jgi:hypothetical protein
MRNIFLIFCAASLSLVGCSYQTDVTNESRFKGIVAKNVRTKKEMRLYGFGYQPSADDLFDLTTTDRGKTNFIGLVPVGHPVRLKKITQHHDIGIIWEQLQGEISFKGHNYPFAFELGTSAYPDKWKRIFESFESTDYRVK